MQIYELFFNFFIFLTKKNKKNKPYYTHIINYREREAHTQRGNQAIKIFC